MKKIMYTRADGGLSIVNVVSAGRIPAETDDEFAARIMAKAERLPEESDDDYVARIMVKALRRPAESDNDFFGRIMAKDVPSDATNVTLIDDVPVDRTFRDAWSASGTQIVVDMPKARAIQLDRVRAVRDVELAALDIAYQVALEKNQTAEMQAIAAKKQILRDLPATLVTVFDAAQDTEALKALDPATLVSQAKGDAAAVGKG